MRPPTADVAGPNVSPSGPGEAPDRGAPADLRGGARSELDPNAARKSRRAGAAVGAKPAPAERLSTADELARSLHRGWRRTSSFVKVLLADSDPQRAAALEASLARDLHVEVLRLPADESLREAAAKHLPDVVIVDMSRPDRDGLEGIRQVTARDPLPVVLFVDVDDSAFMEEAIAAGVSSYNVVGAALPDVKPIVRAAIAMFRRFRSVETELRKAEASLAERQAIDRAKALLMRRRGCSEPQAYALLRRQAMDSGRRVAEVAAEILARPETC